MMQARILEPGEMHDSQSVPTVMVACYLLKQNRVLLGLRKKVSWGMGLNLLSGIGGKVGDIPGLEHETEEEAIKREANEEINVDLYSYHNVSKATFLFPNRPKWNQVVTIFIVHKWAGEPTETAAIKPVWYNIDQLPFAQMWDDAKYYLPLLLHGEQVDAAFIYGPDNKTVASKEIKPRGSEYILVGR